MGVEIRYPVRLKLYGRVNGFDRVVQALQGQERLSRGCRYILHPSSSFLEKATFNTRDRKSGSHCGNHQTVPVSTTSHTTRSKTHL